MLQGVIMKKFRRRLFTLFAAAMTLAALSVSPHAAAAQDKSKETQKPPTGTVDAWRQALPPEAEATATPEAPAASAQPRLKREGGGKGLRAPEPKWMGALRE